jgi:hypothetical protein
MKTSWKCKKKEKKGNCLHRWFPLPINNIYTSMKKICCKDIHIIIFSIIGKSNTFYEASNKLRGFHRMKYIGTFAKNYKRN